MSDWRPIETAPKDGSRIRALGEGGEDVVSWSPFLFPEHTWKECPWTRGESGEWNADQGNGPFTHWQPLPEPPEEITT